MSVTKRNVLATTGVLIIAVAGTSTILLSNHCSNNKAPEKNKKSNKKASSSMSVKTKAADLSKLDDYIVVEGDTPESLASHFQVNLDNFLQKYQLSKADQLVPGHSLNEQHHVIIESQSIKDSQNTNDVPSKTPQITEQSPQSSSNVENNQSVQNKQPVTPRVQATQPQPQTPEAPQASTGASTTQTPSQSTPAPAPNHSSDDPSTWSAQDVINNLG